jgi:hypothetical protein
VAIWVASELSEWETLISSLIETISRRYGFPVARAVIPDYAEFDTSFFSTSIQDRSDRWILLRRGNVAEAFLLYTAQYLNIRTLVLAEDFTCPEAISLATPSVSKSISAFVTGEGHAHYAGGSNSGWDALWQALETRLTTPDSTAQLNSQVRISA